LPKKYTQHGCRIEPKPLKPITPKAGLSDESPPFFFFSLAGCRQPDPVPLKA
jgi:hypothetical protein